MNTRKRTLIPAIAVVVAAALGTLALSVGPVTPTAGAEASTDRSAAQFMSLINAYRASNGVAPLAVNSTLAASAQSWAGYMSSQQQLSHDPNLGGAVSGWTRIGENVGMGPTVSMIWDSFLASAPHRANLLNPEFTHYGIGFVTDSHGALWTAHRFMRSGSTAPPPTTPPPTNPPPTTPPPTAPPVTTPANPGDTVDCTSFSAWDQANHWFLTFRPYYGDVGGLDPDGDGVACEELPGAPVPVASVVPAANGYGSSTSGSTAPGSGSESSGSGSNGDGSGVGSGDGSDGDADGSGDGSNGGGSNGGGSADPGRVAEVIDALRALPS